MPRVEAPFPLAVALSTEELAVTSPAPISQPSALSSPASNVNEPLHYIPGEPTIGLEASTISGFLAKELATPVLDELYPRLWLVARKSGNSIDPLHRQVIKGREIVPAEDPKLHLVWYYNRIYVKPIPVCLLNYHFWMHFLPLDIYAKCGPKNVLKTGEQASLSLCFDRTVALGFLRSYAFLIQHRSDFVLAREHHLIPDDVDFVRWSRFIDSFRHLEDHQVAKRYHYGQLRLPRLHWVNRIFRPKSGTTMWFYEVPYWSTGAYISQTVAPLLFIFASLSLVLSAMQVILAVPVNGVDSLDLDSSGLQAMWGAFWVFSIALLFASGLIWTLLIAIPLGVLAWQLEWGIRNRKKSVVKQTSEA